MVIRRDVGIEVGLVFGFFNVNWVVFISLIGLGCCYYFYRVFIKFFVRYIIEN